MKESFLGLMSDVRTAREQGAAAIMQRQQARLAEMVAFARANSPYYRELYQDLPEHVEDPTLLPVTTKKGLMLRFDDWVTDREVTVEKARAFVENPDLVGELFLGKYIVAMGSGTRGFRALYLMLDEWSSSVYTALLAYQANHWFPSGELLRILTRDGGKATLVATSCNFPLFAGTRAQSKNNARAGKNNQVFSVQTPLPELVAQLNQFRPIVLEGYASTIALLASEQEAGRLHINPILVTLESESLIASECDRIARAFNARVGNVYSCSECPALGYSCEHGWLHIHSDWVMFEPVDADYQPTPPGEPSHTVLISNLYNRAQPILRYDLGDSILLRPDPCPCGNPLPAVRVLGRSGDVLTFFTRNGDPVSLSLIMLAADGKLDRISGIDMYQLVQTSPTSMDVRMLSSTGVDPDQVWQEVHAALTRMFAMHDIAHVAIERAEEPPEQTSGGKYRVFIAMNNEAASVAAGL